MKKRSVSRDRVRGCLLGGAVGDALGYPVEFKSYAEIVSCHGRDGIRDFVLNSQSLAEISDDTQMTLFTATGLVYASTRLINRGTCGNNPEDYVKYHYLDWYRTQTMDFEEALSCPHHDSFLVREERLYRRRAPGNTCLIALRDILYSREVANSSKGCGGIMRVAPVAVFNDYSDYDEKTLSVIASRCALLTHGHCLSSVSAAALVQIIYRITRSTGPVGRDVLERIVSQVAIDAQRTPKGYDLCEETFYDENPRECEQLLGILNRAIALASDSQMSDVECIHAIGGGWVAEEALAIAVFCVLRHPESFEDAVVAAVNHDGDSDSTGAICGNIMGALLGEGAIPEKFLDNLELKDVISEVADDLYFGCRITDCGTIDGISEDEARRWIANYSLDQ